MIQAPGIYNDTKIIDCGFGESGDNKTPHLFVIFSHEGEEITGYFYLTEKSAKYTQEKMLAMGVPKDMDWPDVCDGIEAGTLLIGNLVQINVKRDSYGGKERLTVDGVRPNNFSGGPTRSETAGANAKKFGALWRNTVKTSPTAPAAPAVNTVPPEDDDIPF